MLIIATFLTIFRKFCGLKLVIQYFTVFVTKLDYYMLGTGGEMTLNVFSLSFSNQQKRISNFQ